MSVSLPSIVLTLDVIELKSSNTIRYVVTSLSDVFNHFNSEIAESLLEKLLYTS